MKKESAVQKYTIEPQSDIQVEGKTVYNFEVGNNNIDMETVVSFGEEWSKFNDFSVLDIKVAGDQYFDIVPEDLYKGKYILDVGCGTGRWSKYLSRQASEIEAIDPSEAVLSAAVLLQDEKNVRISRTSVDNIPFADNSFDLVFSLGVLHHIPDTQAAMKRCVEKVKPEGYFLVYLYYAFDNRGFLFKSLFHLSNVIRLVVSNLPSGLKKIACDILAMTVYMPFIFLSKCMKIIGLNRFLKYVPLSYYSDKSINIIRNDSLDRFGTPLEQRFTKDEIRKMMVNCGLDEIQFSGSAPFWHAIGRKK